MNDPYVSYYLRQAGSGVGPIFKGSPLQRGHGIGSFLSQIFRSVFPLLKSGAKAVGKEALNAGFGVLRDSIDRKPLHESVKARMREAGGSLMTKAERKIDSMKGSGYKCKKRRARRQSVSGIKRRKVTPLHRDIFS